MSRVHSNTNRFMIHKATTRSLVKTTLFVILLATLLLSSCAKEQITLTLKPRETDESVILIHGLGRSNTAMWLLASRLEDAGFHVHSVGYNSFNTSLSGIKQHVADQIDSYYQSTPGTIHFVGHSMGGLLIRSYLQDRVIATLGKVVLIGTPNQGTPLADRVKGNWLLEAFNTPAQELGTSHDSFPLSLADPYYPVGIIAGKTNSCLAKLLIAGENDGLVPVASTQVMNMSDFMVLNTGHSSLRYDKETAIQTIFFLINGHFSRK